MSPVASQHSFSSRPLNAKRGTITKSQKTAIWTLVQKAGIDVDTFRGWLKRQFRTGSTRELSIADAAEVIEALQRFCGQAFARHKTRTWGVTEKQLRYVRALCGNLGWRDPKRVDGLVGKLFSPKNRVELLNKREATTLIIALEKMVDEVSKGTKSYA